MQRVESFLQTAELIQCVDLMELFFFLMGYIYITTHKRQQSSIYYTENS